MRTGLLWYDDDPERSLEEKVRQAAQRYCQKFGTPPDVCYVHPSVLGDEQVQGVDGIRVATLPHVLRYHFLVRREGAKERSHEEIPYHNARHS